MTPVDLDRLAALRQRLDDLKSQPSYTADEWRERWDAWLEALIEYGPTLLQEARDNARLRAALTDAGTLVADQRRVHGTRMCGCYACGALDAALDAIARAGGEA
jgi:hypothetical protein